MKCWICFPLTCAEVPKNGVIGVFYQTIFLQKYIFGPKCRPFSIKSKYGSVKYSSAVFCKYKKPVLTV